MNCVVFLGYFKVWIQTTRSECFNYSCVHNGCLWRLSRLIFFHLQITGVCNHITSPVTGKSTYLAFKFGEKLSVNPFSIYISNI